MKATIGVVGLGKLGLPIAVTLAANGYDVIGHDLDPERMTLDALAEHEMGPDGVGRLAEQLSPSLTLRFADLDELAGNADCVFIVVQTPNEQPFDGVAPLLDSRADYRYDALIDALSSVARRAPEHVEIGVMSTVMPGTTRARLLPLVEGRPLIYCPQFAALGTVARDLCQPEFTLIGEEHAGRADAGGADVGAAARESLICDVLGGLGKAPLFRVGYETAELAKVLYNTFVSAKVAVANTVQRMSDEVGASATGVFDILRAADHRLLSGAYLGPGMGDGGPCHPRDNLALSWVARQRGMGFDFFSALMIERQSYVEWLAERFLNLAAGLPLVVLGTAYKPGTDLEAGSSVVLMTRLLELRQARPAVIRTPGELRPEVTTAPAAYFLGCPEQAFVDLELPPGSVVVDPWHRMPMRDGVSVIRIGEP
jgi:UDPglucose 6-dehydrogenase